MTDNEDHLGDGPLIHGMPRIFRLVFAFDRRKICARFLTFGACRENDLRLHDGSFIDREELLLTICKDSRRLTVVNRLNQERAIRDDFEPAIPSPYRHPSDGKVSSDDKSL